MGADVTSLVDRDHFRAKLLPFTRKAFRMIPRLDRPAIVDIGCGSGVVTLELAALTNGRITGVDIDKTALKSLERRFERAGLSARVETINCSMNDLKFAVNSFDIVWSEGSIFVIGFEQGLAQWRRFIRPDRFLVLHARKIEIEKRVRMISELGYNLLSKFLVPKDAWWNLYYGPLEKRVNLLQNRCKDDACNLSSLNTIQKEIDEFKRNPEYHGSVFYVCQKAGVNDHEEL
jgi:ubiquinone/menaquinone biosynthesis C-methylase UbiE